MDVLLVRGATAKSGRKPAGSSPRIVEEAKSFSEAARRIGQTVGCRLMALGTSLGTLAGTPKPTPMCAYEAHIVIP